MKIRKQNTGLIVVLFFLILTGARSYSQTYSFKYKCTLSGISEDPQKLKSDSIAESSSNSENNLSQLLWLIPFRINTTYEIISDGRYMIITARVDSSSTESFGVKINPSNDEEAIIDIKGKLIFFSGSKIVRKLKIYTLDSSLVNSSDCSDRTVQEKGADYKITFCKSIPSAVSPPILFSDQKYGIKSINVPQIKIELSFYKKIKKDKKLSKCPGYFKKYPVSNTEEGFFDW